mmetsp:Transcript_46640/g.131815  ORF Transcript_46640/g.131815 Transcript_46640/m.131815 type:complete len:422 (+) Transcript_46640:92-1357(+)
MERVHLRADQSQLFPKRSAVASFPAPAGLSSSALRIVAVGDSLTAGFPSLEPYGQALAEALAEMGAAVDVTVCGLCGIAAQQMLAGAREPGIVDSLGRTGPGLAELVRARRGAWCKADLVLLMVGTSDLTSPTPADQICAQVRQLHKVCHAEGVRTVALGVPDAARRRYKRQRAVGKTKEYEKKKDAYMEKRHNEEESSKILRRREVNGSLAAWARGEGMLGPADKDKPSISEPIGGVGEAPSLEAYLEAFRAEDAGGDEDAVPSLQSFLDRIDGDEKDEAGTEIGTPELFVNVCSLLPYGPQSRRAGLWEKDGVHFSSDGSRAFGRRLAVLVRPLLSKLKASRLYGQGMDIDDDGTATPSLDTFLEAFRLEDEGATGGGTAAEAGEGLWEDRPHATEWEEEAAVRLQAFFRARRTPHLSR